MKTDLGELDLLRDLAARLDQAQHGGRTALVDEAKRVLCCSRQDVYRRLADKAGWASGRKRRKDKGDSRLSEATAQKAAHLMHLATRANGKRTIPLTVARDILRDSGIEDADVSTSTLSRIMRRAGCHPAMLRTGHPSQRLRTLHPNHVWQVDPSLCILFYLPKGGLMVCEESKFYKNKPKNVQKIEKERVWRYTLTDHFSGTIYVRYVQAAGESAQSLVDVFLEATRKRGPFDPMHGVPFILLMDAGSANTSALFLNLLDRLGVEYIVHMPGNPRAKGSVEVANNIVETQFEGRLAFHHVENLEQLQEAADRWRTHYNAHAIHSRHGRTRNSVWLTIAEDQLRLAPDLDLCRELVTTRPKDATVRPDMTITHAVKGHGRNAYDVRLIPGLVPQAKVKVVVNPYRAPAVDVITTDATGEAAVWTVEPVRTDDAGFWADAPVIGQEHHAQPDTLADRHVKAIAEAAGPDKARAKAPEGVNVMADVDARPAPEYLPKRGRDLVLDASRREIPPLTHVEAAMQLRREVGDAWTADAWEWLQQHYPDGVPAEDMAQLVARFTADDDNHKTAPLRVIGGSR